MQSVSSTNDGPKVQVGSQRAALIRNREAEVKASQQALKQRGCTGCKGRIIRR